MSASIKEAAADHGKHKYLLFLITAVTALFAGGLLALVLHNSRATTSETDLKLHVYDGSLEYFCEDGWVSIGDLTAAEKADPFYSSIQKYVSARENEQAPAPLRGGAAVPSERRNATAGSSSTADGTMPQSGGGAAAQPPSTGTAASGDGEDITVGD